MMTTTLLRRRTLTCFGLTLTALTLAVGITACDDDTATGPSAEIRKFCQDLFASPAFSCCSAADKAEGHFAARYKYRSADDCAVRLAQQADSSQGRQSFDGEAAASCLSHLSSRQCGVTPSAKTREDEEKAGCARILKGKQEENAPCNTNDDCKVGLLCPPSPDTGVSSCAKPAGSNQGCPGDVVATSFVDHPPCEANLFCTLTGENPICPSPPCLVYQCVPLAEENEACTGLECGPGLSCKDGVCAKGGLGAAGVGCRINDHCADGLFCDNGKCAPRKEAGAECRPGANAIFECKGFCKNVGDGPGTCASFCGG